MLRPRKVESAGRRGVGNHNASIASGTIKGISKGITKAGRMLNNLVKNGGRRGKNAEAFLNILHKGDKSVAKISTKIPCPRIIGALDLDLHTLVDITND